MNFGNSNLHVIQTKSLESFNYRYMAAKTDRKKNLGISVYMHCLAVGVVTKKILHPTITHSSALNWLGPDLIRILPFLAACHDLGKICAGFQAMIRGIKVEIPWDNTYGSTRHEIVTYNHVQSIFSNALCRVLLYHHGSNRNGGFPINQCKDTEGTGWKQIRNRHLKCLAKYFDINDLSQVCKVIESDPVKLKYIAGLIVVSDWIASDESCFSPKLNGYNVKDVPVLANSALTRYGFRRVDMSGINNMSFQDLFNIPVPNDGQIKMMSIINGPGLYLYEAPMGIGKTEAALYPALKLYKDGIADGVYFAMPTQVTSNRILKRFTEAVTRWFDSDIVRLIHGTSDTFHNPNEDDWYKGNKRALLDDFGAGTTDQALLSVLPSVKHFFIRTYGLYRKVVIIDEVHSYDVYTSGLIKSLINDLLDMDCVVILLTATLTEGSKKDLFGVPVKGTTSVDKPYPLITYKKKGEINISEESMIGWSASTIDVPVNICFSSEDLLSEALQKAKEGMVVLWIENTVQEAQDLYDSIPFGVEKGLLHSRFVYTHREIKEKKWIDKLGKGGSRSGCILVSTQVCEQSLDIDADVLYTRLCPTDMLLQRIGRLWRHRSNVRPINCKVPLCTILWESIDEFLDEADKVLNIKTLKLLKMKNGRKSLYVYDPYVLCRTLEVIKCRKEIKLPEDIRTLLELTYSESSCDSIRTYKMLNDQISKLKKEMETKSNVSTNVHNLFSTESIGTISDLSGIVDDPDSTSINTYTSSTRLIDDGSKKICLLTGNGITLFGALVCYPCYDKSNVKEAIMRSSITIPAKSVKLLEDAKCISQGIEGDKYTDTVFMKQIGMIWIPLDSQGNEVHGIKYTQETGWYHE